MTALLAAVLLLLTPLIMLLIRLIKRGFSYYWLVAAAGSLGSLLLVLLSGLNLPQSLLLIAWKPEEIFSASPSLLVDMISWPYAAAVAGLAAAVILTAVARIPYVSWRAWSGTLLIAGAGLFAVLAGNPLTLLLAWAALDLGELVILLVTIPESRIRERIVVTFSVRAAGILLVAAADVVSRAGGQPLTFDHVPPYANLLLLLAAGLRLGVLPLHMPFFHEAPLRRGLGTMLRLIPAAGSLVLLSRTALSELPVGLEAVLLLLAGLSALYSAGLWAAARDELSGRPFWVLGMASFAVAAALKGEPEASLAWGLSLLIPGGVLFLYSARRSGLLPVLMVGLVLFSALPFTPAWQAARIYSPPYHPALLLLLAAHALLMVGYFRHASRPGDPLSQAERSVWILYPAGLVLLLAVYLLLGTQINFSVESIPAAAWAAGLLSLGLAGAIAWASRRISSPPGLFFRLDKLLSLRWIYTPLWKAYKGTGWVVDRVSNLLEGEGGVLWVLVILAFLFTIFSQGGAGN
jgi:hypothetical protein